MTTYNNETYRIDDVDENADPSSTFNKKDGSAMSYNQYYQDVCFFYTHHTILVLFCVLCINVQTQFRNGMSPSRAEGNPC